MLYNVPKLIKRFTKSHKDTLSIILSDSLLRYITALIYAVLPILIVRLYNEWIAGLFLGIFNLLMAFIFNPIVGNFADRFGSKYMLVFYKIFMIFGALILLFFKMNIYTLIIFSTILFIAYSLRINETYILRVTKKDEGGLMFGLSENIYSISYFLATLSIPYFTITGNYTLAAKLMLIFAIFNLILVLRIKNDLKYVNKKKESILKSLNPILSLKNAIHFIKMNNNYPIMAIAASIFQGIFYGTIWFIFPVHLANINYSGIEGGLQLGIYELVTIFLAGYSGYLADKYNWKYFHSLGWVLILIGVILMPVYSFPSGLIIIGLIIGIGNNFSFFSAEHVLEAKDIDHKEDGAFMAVNKMSLDASYAISPIIAGFLYNLYGFSISLFFSSIICSFLAVWMIYLTLESEK